MIDYDELVMYGNLVANRDDSDARIIAHLCGEVQALLDERRRAGERENAIRESGLDVSRRGPLRLVPSYGVERVNITPTRVEMTIMESKAVTIGEEDHQS